ncbi:MAG: response regulator [Lachnospiraceae bacterium]|jgi:YesN/AraC family two-component response regulator|nr:response regulator [Lachnospiraceae bacterium]
MYNVLFVEDEAVMRMAFHRLLNWEEAGFTLATAANGGEAMKYIAANPVDIVVTDLVMPVMDGISLISALHEENFAGVIYVLSNYNDFEHVRQALTKGAADYILKLDIDGDVLLKHLRRAEEILKEKQAMFAEDKEETKAAVTEAEICPFDPEAYQHCRKEILSVLFFIHLHYREKLTLDDIADSVNLNRSYISRLFKQETGQGIFTYLNGLRMKKAAALLAEGGTYVREVAAAVGIDDQFYFTRLFKKHYNVAPSEYQG